MNKEVLEGNKLIAEFIGWSQQLDVEERWYGAWFDQHGVRKAWPKGHEPLLFHKSWDWLMPVVEKIDSRTPYDPCVTIEYNWCSIKVPDGRFDIGIIGNSRIEATWKAVVEFIKWYNEKKNQ